MVLTKQSRISKQRSNHAAKKHPPIDIALSKKIHLHSLGNISQFEIWLVNGPILRDEVDIDFTTGGNPSRYNYVPTNEIWLEDEDYPKDLACNLLHELTECWLMKNKSLTYDKAHEKASHFEEMMRERLHEIKAEDIIPVVKKCYYTFLLKADKQKKAEQLNKLVSFADTFAKIAYQE